MKRLRWPTRLEIESGMTLVLGGLLIAVLAVLLWHLLFAVWRP